ncbi:DUF1176 domain-containing protein [Roseibium sp.]|uniref:DUF1176 domain-containing protein n=1 Tax=Roseibium sp. TaxID=1936156 RepID=UPI003A969704
MNFSVINWACQSAWSSMRVGSHIKAFVAASLIYPASLTAIPSAHAALERTPFADWSLRCQDNNYCIAETEGTASNGEAFKLKIERGAKPGSDVYVTLRPKTTLAEGTTARIEVSGEEENYGFFGKAGQIYQGNEMTFGGAADRALVENLRLGLTARIQIEFGGKKGTLSYEVALTGLTHALLRMDEEQGRIGKLDAIVAWGGVPADAQLALDHTASAPRQAEEKQANAARNTPPASPPPAAPENDLPPPVMPSQDLADGGSMLIYDVNEIPERVQFLGYSGLNCQLDETVPGFGAQLHVAGDEETWIVPCQMADANVPYYMARHISFNPDLTEWLEFETPPAFNEANHALVNNLFYDPQTRQVTGTTYHSPNYDCGVFERHEEMAESGQYELVEYLEKTDCDGVTGPPEGWPRSWSIDEMGN